MEQDLNWQIKQAAEKISQGGVIAYPTETIYGVGCDPNSGSALRRILKFKKRTQSKGFIVIASEVQQLSPWLDETWLEWLSQQHPPQITTWVVPCKKETSPLLRGENTTLAVRISPHPTIKALCAMCGAITSTSVNVASQLPLNNFVKITQQFSDELDWIIPANMAQPPSPKSSRIVDAKTTKIYRK